MRSTTKTALAAVALAAAHAASAGVTFYQHPDFSGRSFTARGPVANFMEYGFNDKASSVTVSGEPWEVCDDIAFRGRCIILRPGDYPSLREIGIGNRISSARQIDRRARYEESRYAPPAPVPQVTLYERDNFEGRSFNVGADVPNLQRSDFNDRTSSVVVASGRWEVCEDSGFHGRCLVLRPGRYATLRGSGLGNKITSLRVVAAGAIVEEARYAPLPAEVAPVARWQPRPEEPLYQAQVVSSRAVYTVAGQNHCWVSHDEVSAEQRRDNRLGGAVIGGLLGGIIGHQIGDSNAATVGGAIGGAAVGAAVGNNVHVGGQDVQHCAASQVQGPPEYWDTTYAWKGVQHHVQTTAVPGTTVSVNEYGEPRGQ
jgi:uncharacterized protein YcfJ